MTLQDIQYIESMSKELARIAKTARDMHSSRATIHCFVLEDWAESLNHIVERAKHEAS